MLFAHTDALSIMYYDLFCYPLLYTRHKTCVLTDSDDAVVNVSLNISTGNTCLAFNIAFAVGYFTFFFFSET